MTTETDYRLSLSTAAGLALFSACLYAALGRYRMWSPATRPGEDRIESAR